VNGIFTVCRYGPLNQTKTKKKMQDIEKWVDSKIKNYSDDSYNLFREAILCYNIKAYRASLLFSYLGFFKYIKELLNKSKKPASFDQGRWDSILRNIKLEDKWEEEILNSLNNSSNPVFNIKDNIRTQIKFWKDRRNDCAHAKDNIINNHHVEIFWTFLKSNLSKITLEGGKQNLLNKFSDHFDATRTSRFESYDHIIEEIENSIEAVEIDDFIKELGVVVIDKAHDYSILYEVYDKILSKYYSVNYIKDAVINYLKNSHKDLDFLSYFPNNFSNFNYSNQDIRLIWSTKLYYSNNSYIKDKILGILLSNISFTNHDLKDCIELYIKNFDQSGFRNLSKEQYIRNLLGNNFFLDKMHSLYFDQDKLKDLDYTTINKQADLIGLYIEKCDLNLNIVKTLSLTYQNETPNFLTDSLRSVLQNNSIVKEKFKELCNSNGIANLSTFY
jgi:hypothetical protein